MTLPYITGLPRDVTVNSLHWSTVGEANDADFLAITSELDSFLNLPVSAPGEDWDTLKMSDFLSTFVERGEDAGYVKFYDVSDDPLVLLAQTSLPIGFPSVSGPDMPNELAACLSITATPALPVLLRNRRGRVYFGPLNSSAVGDMTVGGQPYPALNTNFREVAAVACERMASGPTTVLWQIYSRVLDQAFQVSQGFIDNEFDTMRSRQFRATVRTSWTA